MDKEIQGFIEKKIIEIRAFIKRLPKEVQAEASQRIVREADILLLFSDQHHEVEDSLKERKLSDLEELRQMTSTGPGCNFQQLTEDAVVHRLLAQWEGSRNYKRVKAFNALTGERIYQESLHKKTGQDPISIPGELALLKVYLEKAFTTYAETFGDPGEKPTMDVIRKITAIGLRALENYGCPLRNIEGSLAARPSEHRAGSIEAKMLDAESEELKKVREFEEDPRNIDPRSRVKVSAPLEVKKYLNLLRHADNDLEEKCVHPDLYEQADCQGCGIGKCEFDRRPSIQEPTTPPTEDISEADVSRDEPVDSSRPEDEINEAGFHEVD